MTAIDHPSYKNTRSTEQEIETAIETSKRETRTVELDRSDSAEEQLFVECEGHDGQGLYWGEDCEGVEWQVRLV